MRTEQAMMTWGRPEVAVPVARRTPRDYQRAAIDAARASWAAGTKRTAVVLHCGAGKTLTMAEAMREELDARGGRGLWLANRDFLIKDARKRLMEQTGEEVSVEKAEQSATDTRIVVASCQTLHERRLKLWAPSTFSVIVYDECHHAVSKGSRAILDYFGEALVLGGTATFNRHDKLGMHNVFESIAYERGIDVGVEDGYFCPILPVARYIDGVDFSKMKTTAGDLNLGELEAEMAKVAAPIARACIEEMGDRPCIVYTPGVASAHAVAATLNDYRPGSARAVDADTPEDERDRVLAAFDAGEIQWIVNCGIYLEGLDVPKCRGIVIARPTKSESLYIQMAGRGGRPEGWIGQLGNRAERVAAIAASGKPNFVLLDITGHAGRHSLCSAATLAGKDVDPNELARVLKENPELDIHSAAKEAKDAVKRQQAAIARAAKEAEVASRRAVFDVFKRYDIQADEGIAPVNGNEPCTATDEEWLRANKLCTGPRGDRDVPNGLGHAAVLKLQRTAAKWRQLGFATFKQRRALNNAGVPTPFNLSFAAASTIMNHLAESNWRPNMQFVESLMPRKQGVAA